MTSNSIIAFGQIAEIVGNNLSIDTPDTDSLKKILEKMFPQLQSLRYQIAINKEIISTNTEISEGAQIALLPPFSGG
ncbi:MoaD/ThiS family protein [Taibaiella soli]|uniref:Molybdopterin synthase sulfur carrier subunit n=1 Tax=Taibaiella soli TaxID=1649169 RepID=A0A2W2BF61_9BACT|nr:MoaD/ThiS family protein [Taibaiella soli]PZF74537.1 molybdopterin synthase sulfur carrier subunit [Taibaiella soli]